MKIATISLDPVYANPEASMEQLEEALTGVPEGVELCVLPELFTTGFVKKPELLTKAAEPVENSIRLSRLAELAEERNCAFTGSILVRDGDRYLNRAVFVSPDDTYVDYYDKRHLFTYSTEAEVYKAGRVDSPIVEYRDWRIKMRVCYDLRFPSWCRNRGNQYDLLVLPANWPDAREYAFRQLLIARAIENQAYVAACNRTGEDPLGRYPAGMSQVYSPQGESIGVRVNDLITVAEIDLEGLRKFREDYPFWRDAD